MRNNWKIMVFAVLSGLSVSTKTYAACYFSPTAVNPMSATKSFSVPLAISAIAVPENLPVGSVVYMQNIDFAETGGSITQYRISCSEVQQYYFYYTYGRLPYTASDYNPDSNALIYRTNITGIGVRFRRDNNRAYPLSEPACAPAGACMAGWSAKSTFELIKTKQVVEPGVITGASLPMFAYRMGVATDNWVTIYEVNITGSLNITVPTCDLSPASQSMSIAMGTHERSTFTGVGSGTEWKNASILLTNCPQFYGYSRETVATFNGVKNINKAGLTKNAWALTFEPLDGISDAETGVINLKNQPSTAKGIGIQLSGSDSPSGILNLNQPYGGTISNDGSPSITLPLYVRYIQTSANVSTGRADGKLIYTITYQ